MAIHPIDLQTLYSQLDNLGKTQSLQQQAEQLQQAYSASDAQKKQEIADASVTETKNSDEGAAKIDARSGGASDQPENREDKNEQAAGGAGQDERIIKDPSLGRFIDVSG